MPNSKHILFILFVFLFSFASKGQDTAVILKRSNYPKITCTNKKFCFNSNPTERIPSQLVLLYVKDLSREKNIPELTKQLSKIEKNSKRKLIFGAVGGVGMIVGVGAVGLGLISYDRVSDPSEDLYKFGSAALGVGAGFEIISIVNGINKRKRTRQAVDLYNKYLNY